MDLNQWTVAGRLARDPESRTFEDGKSVTNFTVAVGETWKDANGDKREHTEWVRVVVRGTQADACAKWLEKGQLVSVTGKARTREYERDGVRQKAFELAARDVRFGPKAGGGSGGERAAELGGNERSASGGGWDEEIPFARFESW